MSFNRPLLVGNVAIPKAEAKVMRKYMRFLYRKATGTGPYVSEISGRTLELDHIRLLAPEVCADMGEKKLKKRFEFLKTFPGFAEYVVDFLDSYEIHVVSCMGPVFDGINTVEEFSERRIRSETLLRKYLDILDSEFGISYSDGMLRFILYSRSLRYYVGCLLADRAIELEIGGSEESGAIGMSTSDFKFYKDFKRLADRSDVSKRLRRDVSGNTPTPCFSVTFSHGSDLDPNGSGGGRYVFVKPLVVKYRCFGKSKLFHDELMTPGEAFEDLLKNGTDPQFFTSRVTCFADVMVNAAKRHM